MAKTILLWLAGIGGLLVILTVIGNLTLSGNSRYITWGDLGEMSDLWLGRGKTRQDQAQEKQAQGEPS